MLKFKLFTLFGITALAASAAPILIDNFDTTQTLTVGPGGVNPLFVANAVLTGANSIGGGRSVILSRTVGAGSASILINTTVPGVMQYNSDSTAAGNAAVLWDGDLDFVVNPLGLGGVDLTDGGTNTLIRALIRSDIVAALAVTVYSSAGNFSTHAFSAPGGGTGLPFTVVDLPFAAFVPTGAGANFSSVGAITLGIIGPQSLDLQLDLLAANEIPEPATFILTGTALIGLAALGRRFAR